MGQFPLRNGVFLMITIYNVNPIGQWGKILNTLIGFGHDFGPGVDSRGFRFLFYYQFSGLPQQAYACNISWYKWANKIYLCIYDNGVWINIIDSGAIRFNIWRWIRRFCRTEVSNDKNQPKIRYYKKFDKLIDHKYLPYSCEF